MSIVIANCQKDELLNAISAVSGSVERRSTLPILSNVLLKKVGQQTSIMGSDLSIQLTRMGELGGGEDSVSTTVNAQKLNEVLRLMPEGKAIIIKLEDRRMLIESGRSKFSLMTLPAEDFPNISSKEEAGPSIKLSHGGLRAMLNRVSYCIAINDVRYVMTGMLVDVKSDKVVLVATDGYRLAIAEGDTEPGTPEMRTILPRKTVLEMARLLKATDGSNVTIQLFNNQAKINIGGTEMWSKVIEGMYPSYSKFIAGETKAEITLERAALQTSARRVQMVSDEKLQYMKMSIVGGLMTITTTDPNNELYEELDVDQSGEDISTCFDVRYIVDALDHIDADEINLSFSASDTSMRIGSPSIEGLRVIVTPVKL